MNDEGNRALWRQDLESSRTGFIAWRDQPAPETPAKCEDILTCLCRSAGRTTYELLPRDYLSIPNVAPQFCCEPGGVPDGQIPSFDEAGEPEYEVVYAFDNWWLAFVRYLADRDDVPVDLRDGVLARTLHEFWDSAGDNGGVNCIWTPTGERLRTNWHHILHASAEAAGYLLHDFDQREHPELGLDRSLVGAVTSAKSESTKISLSEALGKNHSEWATYSRLAEFLGKTVEQARRKVAYAITSKGLDESRVKRPVEHRTKGELQKEVNIRVLWPHL